ncbi:RND family efflux transporter MFP subunit [Evansella vedderi]|uniref:RND family efflux transporter MFP subunit n=1 Tax=Evansella vedderi TaxID=38282 RepID=A0ABT9ZQC5_9BACI|nr:efflux RND transporter periplasmic adaptor subunit [Evansella vedderi]MDQ0253440.1 RND family efflux transporter MFP subunit [Evansella vedderi]
MEAVSKNVKRICLTTIAFLFLVGCNGESEAQSDEEESNPVFPVEIIKVEKGILTDEASISGTIMAARHMPVLSMLTGEVTAVHVENGDTVEKGDVLIEVDASDIELNISQARAGLQAAEANYNSAKAMREQGIKQAELQLEQAQELHDMLSNAEEAMDELVDAELLSDVDNIPEEFQEFFTRLIMSNLESNLPTERDIAQGETAVKQAEMALEQAEGTAQLEAAEAQVKQAEIALEMAEKQKSNAVITAPMAGQITNFNTMVGEMVSPQAPLLQLVQMDEPLVRMDVNESMLPNLKVDQEVEIHVPSFNKTYNGLIKYIGIMPGEQSRSYPVEITITDADEDLRIGMHARAIIHTDVTEEQVLVPVRTVVDENGEKFVYVTADGETVERRRITIGNETSEWFEIVNGLEAEEFIVERGIHQLYDGAQINVRNGDDFNFSN